jgi:hypothetical protein
MPMLGVTSDIFRTVLSSTRIDGSFFSVASTTPLDALIPRDVAPEFTACRAYSIWTSFPDGENVVKEKLQERIRSKNVTQKCLITYGPTCRPRGHAVERPALWNAKTVIE